MLFLTPIFCIPIIQFFCSARYSFLSKSIDFFSFFFIFYVIIFHKTYIFFHVIPLKLYPFTMYIY